MTDEFNFLPLDLELDDLLALGLERRSDLKEMESKLQASEHQVGIEKAGYKPKVFLVGELNYNDSTFAGTNGDSFKIMAIAKMNLFNGKRTRSKVRRADSRLQSYQKYRDQMVEGIQLQIKQAWFNLQESSMRYLVASDAFIQAEKSLAIRQARFEKGIEKTADLMDADTAYEQAATRKLHSLFDFLKAEQQLLFVTGTTTLRGE